MVPILGIIFVFGAPAVVIIVLAKLWHERRMEMIRQGINPSMRTAINNAPAYPGEKSLLWGLIMAFLGVAAIISTSINSHSDPDFMNLGLLSLGAGLALLVYWKLTAPERERARRLFEDKLKAETASSPQTTPQPSCPETEPPAPEGDSQTI